MLADAVNASKLPATQKKALVERLSSFLCSHQAESVSKHIISFEKSRKGSSTPCDLDFLCMAKDNKKRQNTKHHTISYSAVYSSV